MIRIYVILSTLGILCGGVSAGGVLFTATPAGADTCSDGMPLGIQELKGVLIPEHPRLFLIKCDCQCTFNEHQLQVVSVRDSKVLLLAEYTGFGIRSVEAGKGHGAVFSVVESMSTPEGPYTGEDTVRFSEGRLIGANGNANPQLVINPSLVLKAAGAGLLTVDPQIDYVDLWKHASRLFKSGNRKGAGDLVLQKAGGPPYPISGKALGQFNDLGYFLVEAGHHGKAVEILRAVLAFDPDRTVAYLNLGDALEGKGRKDSAEVMLREYVRRMEAKGKGKSVPERVRMRIIQAEK